MRKKLSPVSPTSFNPVITSQTSDSEEHSVRRDGGERCRMRVKLTNRPAPPGLQASEHIPPGYEAVSLLEALNGPLSTPPGAPPPLHAGPGHVSGVLPPYGSEPHPGQTRSLSPLEHSGSSQGLKVKKSSSK